MSDKPLALTDAHDLAGDLLHALAAQIGDHEGVAAVLRHWLGVLGTEDAQSVLLGAVWRTFTECLTYADDVPPGSITFHERTEDQ